MCCIFTCCSWVVDLIQRLWTFAMSCVIASAVCCVCFTSSISGVALGYNYSLAEYIDLKETNVSVYFKRGVFDDVTLDESDWRRSGRIGARDNSMSNQELSNQEEMPLRSGRRLDNSIYEADDRNRFEGSLMKLTAKPPYSSTPTTGFTVDPEMQKIRIENEKESPERLKAIQSLINMRKSALAHINTAMKQSTINARYGPRYPDYHHDIDARRMPPSNEDPYVISSTNSNPLRDAVPRYRLKDPMNWIAPKLPPSTHSIFDNDLDIIDVDKTPTFPPPITPRGPIRPTRPSSWAWPTQTARRSFVTPQEAVPKHKDMLDDESMDHDLKEKIFMDQFDEPNIKMNIPKSQGSKKSDEVYDYEARGLPVRKRRSVSIVEVKSSYFTTRLQINNTHSETSSVASDVNSKKDNYVTSTDKNNSDNNTINHSGNNFIVKLLKYFYGKFNATMSKNKINTDEKTDMMVDLDAFKSVPVEVTKNELLTKILQTRFLS